MNGYISFNDYGNAYLTKLLFGWLARLVSALTILVDKSKKIHHVMFKRTNLLEDSFIKFMLNEMMRLTGSSQDKQQSNTARVELFERIVQLHFDVEEQLLFPLYQKKSPQAKQAVLLFCSEHQKITDTFQRYKKIDDRD